MVSPIRQILHKCKSPIPCNPGNLLGHAPAVSLCDRFRLPDKTAKPVTVHILLHTVAIVVDVVVAVVTVVIVAVVVVR